MIELYGPAGTRVNADPSEVMLVDGRLAFGQFGSYLGASCPSLDPTKPIPMPPIPPTITFPGLVSVRWDTFWKDGWKASGGNQFWQSKAIKESDPTAKKGLALAAKISKKHFENYFGPGQDYASMKMADVLTRYKDKLVTKYGSLVVPVLPKPTERADEYVRRGGWLLWTDPETGVYRGLQYIVTQATIDYTELEGVDRGKNKDRIDTKFDLFVKYYPAEKAVRFRVRRYITTEEKVIHGLIWFMDQLAKGGKKFCDLVTNDKLAQIASYASMSPQAQTPQGQAVLLAWRETANQCGKVFPSCPPTATLPPPTPDLPSSLTTPKLEADRVWYKHPATIAVGGAAAVGLVALLVLR